MTKVVRLPKALRSRAEENSGNQLLVSDEPEVVDALKDRPDLAQLIAEAAERLLHGAPGAKLRLRAEPDPDYGGPPTLFLGVSFNLGESEDLAELRRFDESWWVHQVPRADGLLVVDLDDEL